MNWSALKFIGITLLFSLFVSATTHAQKQTLIGLNVNTTIYPEIELNKSTIGAAFETRIGKHSGGETGFFYFANRATNIISYSDTSGSHSYSFTVAERYLTVPVLYKYYSKLINFSAGPAFNFYLGWKQNNDEFPYQMQSYTVHPKVRIGFLTKVSKSIPVAENFIIEPEIRLSSVQTIDEATLGIGIAGKYNF